MVYSDPDNVEMLVAAIVLGLLAPVLAFSIASGSGISALSTISYSSQTFGIGTGITPFTPQTIDQSGELNQNHSSSEKH